MSNYQNNRRVNHIHQPTGYQQNNGGNLYQPPRRQTHEPPPSLLDMVEEILFTIRDLDSRLANIEHQMRNQQFNSNVLPPPPSTLQNHYPQAQQFPSMQPSRPPTNNQQPNLLDTSTNF